MAMHVGKMSSSFAYKPWGMWTLNGFTMFVSDCETLSEVYKNKALMEKPMIYTIAAEFIGNGLLTMNGPMYKAHRKIGGLIFGKSAIDTNLPMINEEVSKLIQLFGDLADGSSVDVRNYIDDHIAAASLRSLAPERIDYSDLRPLYHEARNIFKIIQLRAVNPLYYWLRHHLKSSTRKTLSRMKGYLAGVRRVFDEELAFIAKRLKDMDIEDLKPIEIWCRAFIQLYGIENCAEPACCGIL